MSDITWLNSLGMIISLSVDTAADGTVSFFLWPSSVPFIPVRRLFIRCSIDGHSGCLPVFAVVNTDAVNTGVQVPFWIMVFFCLFVFLKYLSIY